jgi:hypothetical protein
MFRISFCLLSVLILVFSCNSPNSRKQTDQIFNGSTDPSLQGDPYEVIYSLYLPTDVTHLFEETGTGFNPDLILPLERIPLYEDPGQMAILIGALGVDLSYCKLFERAQEAAECYLQIELLADKLGLPEEIFERSSTHLEEFINKPDSLTELIEEVYRDVDAYFKSNNQESLASLSLLGGWLEAMYIGVRIFQDMEIIEMGDRILQQKFALTSLSGILGSYQESLVVRHFMHPLNELRTLYDQVEIRYSRDGFTIEPGENVFRASVSEIIYQPKILDQICQKVFQVREEIIP